MASANGFYADAHYAMVTAFFFLFPFSFSFCSSGTARLASLCSGAFHHFLLFSLFNRAWPVISDSWRFPLIHFSLCIIKKTLARTRPLYNGRRFCEGEQDTSGLGRRLQIVAVGSADQRWIYLPLKRIIIGSSTVGHRRCGWPECFEIGRLELQKDFPLILLTTAFDHCF
jgi:hypothetical protein